MGHQAWSDDHCSCRYRDVCVGYFKLPDRAYRCDQIIRVFAALEDAAGQLLVDVQAYDEGAP